MDDADLPLRGYRSVMEKKYAAKSGHACMLARRYLRYIKWTSSSNDLLPSYMYKRMFARFERQIAQLAMRDILSFWVAGVRADHISLEQKQLIEQIQSFMRKL